MKGRKLQILEATDCFELEQSTTLRGEEDVKERLSENILDCMESSKK